MRYKELQQIYSEVHLTNSPISDPLYLCIPIDEGYATLLKSSLTSKEQRLLLLLGNTTYEENSALSHLWYQILFENKKSDYETPVRILQVEISIRKDFAKKEWLETIDNMFPGLADSFWISEQHLILIEKKDLENYSVSELFGIFQALDSDFDCYSRIFIGNFYDPNNDLSANFQTERAIFFQQKLYNKTKKEFTLSNSAIDYLLVDPMREIPLFKSLYEIWFSDKELIALLKCLWQAQGNISAAAKALFIHRNTIKYRIDKFQELTNLDLKKMDDLVFCHILIENFYDN